MYISKTNYLTLDHTIPKHMGGSGRQSNLEVMCHKCNNAKGSSIVDLPPFISLRRFIAWVADKFQQINKNTSGQLSVIMKECNKFIHSRKVDINREVLSINEFNTVAHILNTRFALGISLNTIPNKLKHNC